MKDRLYQYLRTDYCVRKIKNSFLYYSFTYGKQAPHALDLCGGSAPIPGYFNVGLYPLSDLVLDLEKKLLPFHENSVERVVCMSAINYFTYARAEKIIADIYRVLISGGVTRFGVQDIELIAKKFVEKDTEFFFEKLPTGQDRRPGATLGDKFTSFFYGYPVDATHHVQSAYDYEALAHIFKKAGFQTVEQKKYHESRLPNIELIDNRPEQMFFLEAVK